MYSHPFSNDQDTDPDYDVVKNRIDSYYYFEWHTSFTADKSLNVIKILHTKLCNISNSLDNFLEAHDDLNVLAFCESWLTPYSENLYNLPNFICYFESHCQKISGGVALSVRTKYSNKKIPELSYVLM